MSAIREPALSVVVPVFNEEHVLSELHRRLVESLGRVGAPCEIVYVDDGSSDESAQVIEPWASVDGDVAVVLVKLARNFGMEIAMSAGLDFARGDYVVLIHADLQDPPELIPTMLETARNEHADVVYTRRIGSDESVVKRVLATAFYALMGRLARVPYQGQAGDFRLMSRRVVEAVRAMPERRRFLRGMVAWVGFRQVPIEYRRAVRSSGRGASYRALFRLAVEAIVAFSDVPLKLTSYLGFLTASVSGVGAIVILAMTLGGVLEPSVPIWGVVAILFIGGVQLIGIGILGRYLARVHEESLRRPLYVVDRVAGEARST